MMEIFNTQQILAQKEKDVGIRILRNTLWNFVSSFKICETFSYFVSDLPHTKSFDFYALPKYYMDPFFWVNYW